MSGFTQEVGTCTDRMRVAKIHTVHRSRCPRGLLSTGRVRSGRCRTETVSAAWRTLGSRLAAIFHSMKSPLAVLSRDLHHVAASSAYLEITDRSERELLGRNIFEVFPENPADRDHDGPTSLRRSLTAVLETGQADSMPLIRYDVVDDGEFQPRYWHVTDLPIFDAGGRVEMILNNPEEVTTFIDERLRLHVDGHPVSATSSSQTRALDSLFTSTVGRLRSLNDLASSLVGASDPVEVGRAVMRHGLAMVEAAAGSLVLADGDRFEFVDSGGGEPSEAWTPFAIEPGRDPYSDVLSTGEPVLFTNRSAFLERYPQQRSVVESGGHEAWAVLRLYAEEQPMGAIGVKFDRPTHFDTPIRLTLANLTAQAASRAQLVAQRPAAMRPVEEAFQPRLDAIGGVRMSHRYRAAAVGTDAGGDWYDIIDLDDATSLITIGDIANHGVVAIGEMGRARSTVHALAHQGLDPARVTTEAARVLTQLASTFTTGIVARLDHATRELTWSTAGHPHPVLVGADGTVETLDHTHGPPLGSGFDHVYDASRRSLADGDTLVLYTDGLIEGPAGSIDSGLAQLQQTLATIDTSAPDLADRLFDRLCESDRPRDDIAILTIRIEEAAH